MELTYTLAFTTGLLGGFGHCLGMCGPLVATCSLHAGYKSHLSRPPWDVRGVIPHLLYNIGRIITYTFIGAFMGFTGSFVNAAGRISGFQNMAAISAGILMIFMGLSISGIATGVSRLEKHSGLILKIGKSILQDGSHLRYLPLGMAFGFLPCGLSYTAFIASAGTGDLLSGMLVMFFFGLGTSPALLLFGAVITLASSKIRVLAYRISGIAVTAFGAYFVLKGIYHYV